MDRHRARLYRKLTRVELIEPTQEQVLEFCARDPIERVFLEDVARRGVGRFGALARADGTLGALCHFGANLVPSGDGCAGLRRARGHAQSRMIIGESRAVSELWSAAQPLLPVPREDRHGQPVYALGQPPAAGDTGAAAGDGGRPRAAAAGVRCRARARAARQPTRARPDGFRWRTLAQIEEGRSWLWLDDGVIRFKAEASAWTPRAVQLQQVWTDPEARGHGDAQRGLRDLCRLLLQTTPVVTLFVRAENAPAIRLYDAIGMRRVLEYRSILF
jgi:Predicted acetyltransferase